MSTIEFEGVNLGATPNEFLHGLITALRRPDVASVNVALDEGKLFVEPVLLRDEPPVNERALSPREALREKQAALAGEPVGPESIAPDRAGDEGRSGEGLSLNELQAAAEQAEAANLLRDADPLTKPDES